VVNCVGNVDVEYYPVFVWLQTGLRMCLSSELRG
jgi:hypothetical protein